MRLTNRSTNRRPAQTAESQRTICIVDPQQDDYETWHATAAAHGLQLLFFASAEAALRHARSASVELWVVSAEQPGISGCDLCGMLRNHSPHVPVFLVAAEYAVAVEQAAWRARASMFGCKPEHASWLDRWAQSHRRVPLQRAVVAPRRAASADH